MDYIDILDAFIRKNYEHVKDPQNKCLLLSDYLFRYTINFGATYTPC